MTSLTQTLLAIHHDEDGAGATEYIILLILIACVVIAIVKTFGRTVSDKYSQSQEYILKEVEVE